MLGPSKFYFGQQHETNKNNTSRTNSCVVLQTILCFFCFKQISENQCPFRVRNVIFFAKLDLLENYKKCEIACKPSF